MRELPPLLRKLHTHPAQAAALAALVPEMKLEIYSLQRQEKSFASLAGSIKGAFLKHADAEVRGAGRESGGKWADRQAGGWGHAGGRSPSCT